MPLPRDKTAKELGFKVGDRFRVVDDQHSVFSRGTIVTLILDDESSSPKFSGGGGGAYCSFWRLEPLDRAEAPSPYKFKVGDRVRLKSTNGQGARYAYGTVGMTGEITQVGRIESSRDVEAILGGTREVFCSEDLELIHRPCHDHSPGLCCDPAPTDPPHHPHCKLTIPEHAIFTTGGWAPSLTAPFTSPSHKAQPQGSTIMSKLTTLAKKAFDKPTKTLIQARVLNDDLSINDDEFILEVLLDLNKDAIVKAAQERLAEEKAESK